MGQQPKHDIMSTEEMDAMNTEIASHSRLYNKDVSNGEKIAGAVEGITKQILASPIGKISLNDTEQVKAAAIKYLQSCEKTGVLPSKIGLARACGVTRAAADSFCQRNPQHPTSQFLGVLFDGFGELLTLNALSGSVQPIVSIFLSKAIYGYRDSVVIETPVYDPERKLSAQEIMGKSKLYQRIDIENEIRPGNPA